MTLESWERWTDWPLTILAVGFLAAYAWPILDPTLPSTTLSVLSALTVVVWALFGVDYLTRLCLATNRWAFIRSHLLDLVTLALPILRPLRALRVITVLTRLNRRASMSFRGQAVVYVVGAVVLVAFVASLAMLDAERDGTEPNIVNFGDAVWWALTTVTTVGYGDRYPTTGEGRLIAVGLMVAGIALLGVVTAALASWFVERIGRVEKAEAHTRGELADLAEEVRQLRSALDRQSRG